MGGILTYTTHGYMSATMASRDPAVRPQNLRWPPSSSNGSDADWVLIGRNAMSYAGRFHLNEDLPASKTAGQLLHGPIEVSSMPYMVGKTQVRNYTVTQQGGETYLKVWAQGETGDSKAEICWRRIA